MRRALLLLILLGCSKSNAPTTPTSRAVAYLMSRQEDGLWKSKTYSLLASGQAMTPFVLYALSHAPADELAPYQKQIDRALDRLPIAGGEYPSYALALSILAMKWFRPNADVSAMVKQLRAKQLTEDLGWSESDPEYGGWDYGLIPAKKPQCQRPDLSVTAFAVEALGGDAKARRFAERCRAEDGGFFFTPHAESADQNKAGPRKSYATATCDALRILGADEKGGAWLLKPRQPEGEIGESIFYYYMFALSKVRSSRELADSIIARQRPDGSWKNDHALMKEDDPLVATGLALIALTNRP